MKLPGYPCPVCRRASGGKNGATLQLPGRPFAQLCSNECARIFMTRQPCEHDERAAALKGGQAAGQYLDEIGKFNLEALSAAEWEEFCSRLFAATCDELRKQAEDSIPF